MKYKKKYNKFMIKEGRKVKEEDIKAIIDQVDFGKENCIS